MSSATRALAPSIRWVGNLHLFFSSSLDSLLPLAIRNRIAWFFFFIRWRNRRRYRRERNIAWLSAQPACATSWNDATRCMRKCKSEKNNRRVKDLRTANSSPVLNLWVYLLLITVRYAAKPRERKGMDDLASARTFSPHRIELMRVNVSETFGKNEENVCDSPHWSPTARHESKIDSFLWLWIIFMFICAIYNY